jgi:DNA-binding transcriptional LysR family regulator
VKRLAFRTADIAAELGVPPSDLARHARKLGLAIRHGVSAHKHTLADHGGIRLTSAGEKFAQDAVPVLAMLDQGDNETAPKSHQVRRTAKEVPRS